MAIQIIQTKQCDNVIEKRRKKSMKKIAHYPKIDVDESEDGSKNISIRDNQNQEMKRALGTDDPDFLSETIEGLVELEAIINQDKIKNRTNSSLAILSAISPKDELETILATQMIYTHRIFSTMAKFAASKAQTTEGIDRNINRMHKLGRLFSLQMESLDKHRRNGQQSVVVKHVNVSEGGQAIIGNVTKAKGDS
jgi:hypothetical protein